eukprot:CAMPEP_0170361952 /NCGR_PEP_ID=MMETSP0117_2-20130122/4074_1 /TAXON_ID=400756 /ORGANISM="Durinskia baltica, Strain CSIRO CS-38" /LENGTH=152 /DNA_ID=CAMNT_0010616339 /DNA_START=266 /DNA_END=725 /DNA_ORIENTATION=-
MKPEEETAAEPLPPILPATCDEPLPPILPATCNLVGDMIVIDEEEFEGVKLKEDVPDGWATTTQKFKDLDAAIAVVRQREEDFTARSMEEKRKESYADAERLRRKRSLDVEEEFLRKEQEMRLSVNISCALYSFHSSPLVGTDKWLLSLFGW